MPVLQEFTKLRKGERFLTLHIKYASRLSTELAHEIGVEDGDNIHFFKDKVKESDWYLNISKGKPNGSELRKRKDRYGFVFYNTAFAKEIKEQFNQKKDCFRVRVGKKTMIDNKPYWPLITAQLFK